METQTDGTHSKKKKADVILGGPDIPQVPRDPAALSQSGKNCAAYGLWQMQVRNTHTARPAPEQHHDGAKEGRIEC
jgi:hypothetical protein